MLVRLWWSRSKTFIYLNFFNINLTNRADKMLTTDEKMLITEPNRPSYLINQVLDDKEFWKRIIIPTIIASTLMIIIEILFVILFIRIWKNR